MNSATPSDEELNASGFFYFIGITVGVLGIIVSIAIAYHYCITRIRMSTQPPQQILRDQLVSIPAGLDKAILHNYPKLLYAEVTTQNKHTASSCCSICLADYDNTDTLRMLPNCGHLFHLKCVDPWLLQHPSCPICRSSPMTTPQLTPLSEMVYLANRMV